MIINQLKEELEVLESLDFSTVDSQQKQMLKEKYNIRPSTFEYAEDDWGNVVIICSEGAFNNLEYYVGLEYEANSIEYKILMGKKVIVSYSGSDRVGKLLEQLNNSKEVR